MKWNFAGFGLLALLAIELPPAPADACGVKLTVKSSGPRKTAARSSHPSRVLLLGSPPRRLERDLAAAGHDVEVAPEPGSAQKSSYAVVIADSNAQADAARTKFKDATVIVRSGDVSADLSTVEARVARRPVRAANPRTVVAARAPRTPVAAGPTQAPERQMVAVKPPAETAPAPEVVEPAPRPAPPEPKPAPEKIAVAVPREETAPRKEPRAKPAAVTSAALREEIYFSVGSASVSGYRAKLQKAVKWLEQNPGVNVVVEGHADPTGNADANKALSQTRAEHVRDSLVEAGVDASRIEVMSYGDTRLKYGARDRRNRRVAIEAAK